MITGSARVEDLMARRPRLAGFDAPAVPLPNTEILQALFEMPSSAREAIVPPGLHPTNPAALVLQAWRCPESPWGAFSLVQARAQTRSGVRPRGFVLGAACDNAAAASALATGFGFPAAPAEIRWQRAYDLVRLAVSRGGETILALEGADPEPLGAGDVQFSGTLNLADTPRGWRLVQLDPEIRATRAERLRPKLSAFRAAAWGDSRLDPYWPVSASITHADVELLPIRFVCRPDELAFTGTERV
ncbi:MAG TPA: acetoacetate decarboxylase family protein [Myxococcota bacterium]|nr:acetoacetate decarboxylase family protein [Myxococcota bacterium]